MEQSDRWPKAVLKPKWRERLAFQSLKALDLFFGLFKIRLICCVVSAKEGSGAVYFCSWHPDLIMIDRKHAEITTENAVEMLQVSAEKMLAFERRGKMPFLSANGKAPTL